MLKFKLTFLSLLFTMSVGFFSNPAHAADEPPRGVACLKKYATYIHQDISFDTSVVSDVTSLIQSHFKSLDNNSVTLNTIRLLVTGIPFGVTVLNSLLVVVDAYKIIQASIGLLRNEIRKHKFGGTFELMTLLHQLAEEMNHSTEELALESDLLKVEFELFHGFSSFNKLSQNDNFHKIAAASSVPTERYPQMAQGMLEQYLFGDLFCGATDMFEPMAVGDLIGYEFLKPVVASEASVAPPASPKP